MGLPMTGNLVKNGFEVKAFDLNPATLEKCNEIVRIKSMYNLIGSEACKNSRRSSF